MRAPSGDQATSRTGPDAHVLSRVRCRMGAFQDSAVVTPRATAPASAAAAIP